MYQLHTSKILQKTQQRERHFVKVLQTIQYYVTKTFVCKVTTTQVTRFYSRLFKEQNTHYQHYLVPIIVMLRKIVNRVV